MTMNDLPPTVRYTVRYAPSGELGEAQAWAPNFGQTFVQLHGTDHGVWINDDRLERV